VRELQGFPHDRPSRGLSRSTPRSRLTAAQNRPGPARASTAASRRAGVGFQPHARARRTRRRSSRRSTRRAARHARRRVAARRRTRVITLHEETITMADESAARTRGASQVPALRRRLRGGSMGWPRGTRSSRTT